VKRCLLLLIALTIYGSLYPWRFAGHDVSNPVSIVLHSWPQGWTRFVLRDLVVNLAVYFPLGLLAFALLRRRLSTPAALAWTFAGALALAGSMEVVQVYIPGRYASGMDVVADVAGALCGAALAPLLHRPLHRVFSTRPNPPSRAPVILLAAWICWRLFPFFPALSRGKMTGAVGALFHGPAGSAVDVWASAADLFVAVFAATAAFGGRGGWCLSGALVVVAAQPLIVTRTLTPADIAGSLLAAALWLGLPRRLRLPCSIGLLGTAVVLRELEPFQFSLRGAPFSWQPFAASFGAEHGSAVIVLSRKVFEYGAGIWLLQSSGRGFVFSGGLVIVMLCLLEVLQMHIPGRSPEITDPLLALLLALFFRNVKSA
jgi:VanZ family protein